MTSPTILRRYGPLSFVALLHLLASWFVLSTSPPAGRPTPLHMLALAIPLAQTTLVALWAVVSRSRYYVRFALAMVGIVWPWFTLMHIVGYLTAAESAGWMILGVLQCLYVAGALLLSRLLAARFRRRSGGAAPPVQFGLAALMVWTALVAATLAGARTLAISLGWTTEVFRWEYLGFMPIFAAHNAAYALAAFASLRVRRHRAAVILSAAVLLRARRYRVAVILATAVLIGLAGSTLPATFYAIFQDTGGFTWSDCLQIAAFQAGLLYATLIPLSWCEPGTPPAFQPRPPGRTEPLGVNASE